MNYSKFYVNYESQERECGECHKVFPFSAFGFTNRKKKNGDIIPKTYCRPCHSTLEIGGVRLRLWAKYPQVYHRCSNKECEWVYKKTTKFCNKCGGKCE